MAKRAFGYSIALSRVGPVHDPEFVNAPDKVRAEVLNWVLVYGLREKDADLAAGLDKDGHPLAPVTAATRKHRRSAMGPADPNAPALTPAYAVSRTRLLLTGAVAKGGKRVDYWWLYDEFTGGPWGKILDFHRKGVGKAHTVRDVIGISEAALDRVRAAVMARWTAFKLAGMRTPGRPPEPPPAAPGPRLVTVGNTDYQSFTYGVGGNGAPRPGVEATGFFQRKPGQGWTAYGGPTPGRPKPPPPPPAPNPAAGTPGKAPGRPPKASPKPAPAPAPPAAPAALRSFRPHETAEMGAFGGRLSAAWAATLTDPEKGALRDYARDAYAWMNALLRGEPWKAVKADPLKFVPPGMTAKQARAGLALAKAAVGRARTAEGAVLWRGVKDRAAAGLGGLAGLEPGDVVTEKGFTSTSLDPDLAGRFAGPASVFPGNLLVKVEAPAGSRAAYLDAAGLATFKGAEEVVIAPGSSFTFLRRETRRGPFGDVEVAVFRADPPRPRGRRGG